MAMRIAAVMLCALSCRCSQGTPSPDDGVTVVDSGTCSHEPVSRGGTIAFVNSDNGRAVTVPSGMEFDVALGAVRPWYFLAPPTISSASVRFVGESDCVGTPTPAGYVVQTFRFQAVESGQADILISRGSSGPNGEPRSLPGFSLTVQVY